MSDEHAGICKHPLWRVHGKVLLHHFVDLNMECFVFDDGTTWKYSNNHPLLSKIWGAGFHWYIGKAVYFDFYYDKVGTGIHKTTLAFNCQGLSTTINWHTRVKPDFIKSGIGLFPYGNSERCIID